MKRLRRSKRLVLISANQQEMAVKPVQEAPAAFEATGPDQRQSTGDGCEASSGSACGVRSDWS